MPSIAELLATRQAAAQAKKTPSPPAPTPTKPRETIAEAVELQEAIDRISPPGKSRRPSGLVLTSQELPPGENRGQSTPVLGPMVEPPEPRSLSGVKGEQIPMTPVGADQETKAWHHALQAFETDLCAMRDPSDPEAVWIAARWSDRPDQPPILLHRLPILLWDPPTKSDPF